MHRYLVTNRNCIHSQSQNRHLPPQASCLGQLQACNKSTHLEERRRRDSASDCLFTRAGDATRQDIIRISDIADESTRLLSWVKLVDILKAGGKFGLGFRDGGEYMVIDGQVKVHSERQFLAYLQYFCNINKLNAEAVVYFTETS
jgi:hypothetical protein